MGHNEKLLRIDQAAARLNCSKSWIYRLVTDGKLSLLKIGPKRGYRIPESSLDAYVTQCAEAFYRAES